MELEILKIICANQGAVDTEDLMFNLAAGDSSNVTEIISNREKFAVCCPFGQPKVVARTSLRLCRAKDCNGSCRGLHLCKSFLFSGSCQFSLLRRGCKFSHDLDTDHNRRLLREHEIGRLSRAELCTLMLQSDDRILPPICYDYNNGDGEFGNCQDGFACKRLHICEKYVSRDCSCFRNHDFSAPQLSRSLRERGVPDDFVQSLRPVYANIQALKYHDRSGDKGNKNNRGNRGNRGSRGNRGNQDYDQRLKTAGSTGDILGAISVMDSYDGDGSNSFKSSTSDISAAAYDTDTCSEDGHNRTQTTSRGRGGSRGNRGSRGHRGNRGNRGNMGNKGNNQQLLTASSTSDIFAAVSDNAKGDNGQSRRERQKFFKDKTEICMYFIKGYCKHEERCFKAHDKMPYRWEIRAGDKWTPLPDNETIEKDYCDPKNSYSCSSPPVYFDTMTCGLNKVRRLSTINSLTEPNFILTTKWIWYWEDEFGKWNMFASADGGHRPADMDSSKLEQKFLENNKDDMEFKAGSQSYSLSFQDMIQTNKQYGTKRLVKRRPQFVSAADVQTARVTKPQQKLAAVPNHWDKTQIPSTGYKRVPLQRSSDEFKEIEALFCKTMRGFDIVTIERIQNKALWEVFQWQKTQMKNNNGGLNVKEEKLFHGTDNKYVDVICHTNFDWRICGTHGTAYGKGSYFARDAKYSHSYTSDSDVKSMFISRLLVGDYTKGSPDYCRPPSKDGGDINFFDSCVNDVMNPSIYVVFEKHQIYPEYLLQYKNMHPLVSLYAAASAPAPKPVTVPKPALPSKPATPNTVSTQRPVPTLKPIPAPKPAPRSSASVYASTMSSYQPSTSAYPSSAAAYQPSTSFYSNSTASYQPSTLTGTSSTASNPFRSSYSPPASSPTQSAKKNDGCVIA